MNKDYKTVQKSSNDEFVEKRSRFIGYCTPVKSEQEAVDFINAKRSEHWNATHNVYAYSLRDGNIKRYSDDGEPSGTAGMPVLEVITNNEYIRANNIFINRHKLNNKLYDYTDFKKGLHSSIDKDEVNQKSGIIGRFCLFGTVLTKAWEPNLKRYVMIRRLANMPMFSPELDM